MFTKCFSFIMCMVHPCLSNLSLSSLSSCNYSVSLSVSFYVNLVCLLVFFLSYIHMTKIIRLFVFLHLAYFLPSQPRGPKMDDANKNVKISSFILAMQYSIHRYMPHSFFLSYLFILN